MIEHRTNKQTYIEHCPVLDLECTKNGKKYKEGEEFQIGHLRYKCQKYGVYSIEGFTLRLQPLACLLEQFASNYHFSSHILGSYSANLSFCEMTSAGESLSTLFPKLRIRTVSPQ
ncbi:unnamed protein product [Heligmosomoides polygyrus]|uniref:Sushi domain-containing protein n=1 Tax=Heligmosomoides polygyrus TaxID=6339 RepID=A0A183FB46_HELPZ|nr:unnamed protein product [Heligmosomoides polygyrus]